MGNPMKKLLFFLMLFGTITCNYSMEQSGSESSMSIAQLIQAVNSVISNQPENAPHNALQNQDAVKPIESYQCNQCSFSTAKKRYLAVHKVTHDKDLGIEFACDFPGCQFKHYNPKNLRYHKRNSHSELIFACTEPECPGFVTSTKAKLQRHLNRHLSKRLKKTNAKDQDVELHCSFAGCEYTNYKRENLIYHERNSHSDLIFACTHPECPGFVTNTQNKLNRHLVTHTKNSVTELLHCDFEGCSFTNYSHLNLTAHKRRAHKNRKRKAH